MRTTEAEESETVVQREVGGRRQEGVPCVPSDRQSSKKTPLLVDEIDVKDLKKKIKQKQLLRASGNLKPFVAKETS
jgi:hypothetical protein